MSATEDRVAAWCARDAARAIVPADRAAIEATHAARALVVDEAARGGDRRELFNACAVLGGMLARAGATPSLATGTMDGLYEAVGGPPPPWIHAARAALAEGYAAARQEAARAHAAARWEAPACAVPVDATTVAVAAGFPADDGEALAAWAARTALWVQRTGAKRALVAGDARAALRDALQLLGIEVVEGPAAPPRKSWLPWRK